jgi:coenzyme F420-reducing hydrogenase beta subunit
MSTVDIICVKCITCITVKRKTITIREDQDEWIEDQHINLSSFVREQLDELIEERE